MTSWPWSRARRNRELDEEIAAHLRLAVADRIARASASGSRSSPGVDSATGTLQDRMRIRGGRGCEGIS